jgi:hypothetical protein
MRHPDDRRVTIADPPCGSRASIPAIRAARFLLPVVERPRRANRSATRARDGPQTELKRGACQSLPRLRYGERIGDVVAGKPAQLLHSARPPAARRSGESQSRLPAFAGEARTFVPQRSNVW